MQEFFSGDATAVFPGASTSNRRERGEGNVIHSEIHWADLEAVEDKRSLSRSPRPKCQNHLVFMTFRNIIFVVFVFDKISKGMLVTIEKELGEYFQRLHF